MTTKDILLAVIIPLALAEVGPWCGWLAARLLPWAARLRYGGTERAAVRLEEWSDDLDDIPGQLTKLAYAAGQLAAGSAVSAMRKIKSALQRTRVQDGPIAPWMVSTMSKAIGSLPDRQREALELHYFDHLSEAEIAAKMGIGRRALKCHTAMAKSRLHLAMDLESVRRIGRGKAEGPAPLEP